MKHSLIIYAISYIFICFFDSFKARVILALFISISYHFLLEGKKRVVGQALLIILLLCSYPCNFANLKYAHICVVKSNYYIISNHLFSAIVYDTNGVIDEQVSIHGEINEIYSNSNFEPSSFENYCKGNNIIGTIDISNIEIEHKETLRTHLYHYNHTHQKDWINQILFAAPTETDTSYSYLIVASGMQIAFCLYLIRALLSKYLYPDQVLKMIVLLSFLLCYLTHFSYGSIRVFLSLLLELIIPDKKIRTSYLIILLCLYRPYYVKSIAFLIPIGIRLLNTYKYKENNICITLYLCIIQLYFNGYCNVLEIILFPLLRIVSGLFFFLALVCSLVPVEIDLSMIINKYITLLNNLPSFRLTGRINILLLCLAIYLLFEIIQYNQKRKIVLLGLLLIVNQFECFLIPYYTITYLDVGQGDCAIITQPFSSEAVMIDTGGNVYKDVASKILIPYLTSNHIESITVIISHEDYDHMGALESLMNYDKTKEVYKDKQELLQVGKLKIWNPLFDRIYVDTNDNSNISFIKIHQFDFLFLGDISSDIESDLVDIYGNMEADIIKLSHHGSSTGSSEKLLNYTNPTIGIISVGRNNRYNHPNNEVIERLNKLNIKILRTDEDGAIRFYILNHLIIYQTSRGQVGFYFK